MRVLTALAGPELNSLVEAFREGQLVLLPTETVYGLAAPMTHAAAISRLYALKGREASKALPVLLPDAEAARSLAREWPPEAERLSQLWPGPLTMVLPAHPSVPVEVSAGRGTVGLRVPAQPLTLALLRAWGGALATPSANPSGQAPAQSIEQCLAYWPDEPHIAYAIDAGPSRLGIPSTVLEWVDGDWLVHRVGALSIEQLSQHLGRKLLGCDR